MRPRSQPSQLRPTKRRTAAIAASSRARYPVALRIRAINRPAPRSMHKSRSPARPSPRCVADRCRADYVRLGAADRVSEGRLEKAVFSMVDSAQHVVVGGHTADATIVGKHPRLWLDQLRGEDAVDGPEQCVAAH